jgi:pimeloyl-ACP methyl ester carboxylesterase
LITTTDKEPLVLLHALGMSPRVWEGARPLLEPHHEVIALTTLGHRGRATPSRRPLKVGDLVDDVERAFDARGLERPHIAGNSLGGWMAIELARRDRARTVCALSPAGSWTAGTVEQTAGVRKIRRSIRLARFGRALPMPLLWRLAIARRVTLRDIAEHGDRVTAEQTAEATRDLLGCVVADDMLATDEEIRPLDPLPCPITLAWAGDDKLLPPERNGAVARERMPRARYVELAGVGHVAMIDDPEGVARAILRVTGKADDRHFPGLEGVPASV